MWPTQVRRTWEVPNGVAHVVYPLLGDRVEHDDGTLAPKDFTYVEMPIDRRLPFYIVECTHQGDQLLPVVFAVHVIQRTGGREVRSSDWNHLRLEDAVRDAWATAAHQPEKAAGDTMDDLERLSTSRRGLKRSAASLRTRARQRISTEHLAEVARVYRENVEGGTPTKAVRDRFGYPASTASLWVKRARDAGYDLGPPAATPKKPKAKNSKQHGQHPQTP